MEVWRLVIGEIIAFCGIGCIIYAIKALQGKAAVPPDKIMLTGTKEEKEAYKKKAGRDVALKYFGFAVLAGIMAALTFTADEWTIIIGCAVVSGIVWILSRFK